MQADHSNKILLVVVGLLLLGFVGLFIWNTPGSESKPEPQASEQSKEPTCDNALALSLASKDKLEPVRRCYADAYTVNENEKIWHIDLVYGSEQETRYKEYFVRDPDEVIASYDKNFNDPDLSLGSDNKDCKYVWTNDLRMLVSYEQTHIKRSIIKENDTYRWRIELDDFSGQPESDPNPAKCLRTGVLTTDLTGADVQIVGTPEIEIP